MLGQGVIRLSMQRERARAALAWGGGHSNEARREAPADRGPLTKDVSTYNTGGGDPAKNAGGVEG
jgi:hypothetical protein